MGLIFHYVYEVTGLTIEPVHDSVFMLPDG